MPASYHIDAERALVTLRVWGSANGRLLRSIAEDLIADPQWDPAYSRLWDWREMTSLVLTLDEVKAFVASVENDWQAAPRIAIVALREIDQQMAKLFKGYLRDRPCGVFAEIEEAENFLTEARHGRGPLDT